MLNSILTVLQLFVPFVLVYFSWKLLKGLWTYRLGYALGFGVKWCPAPDVWAVVTGGSDGIGLEYAKQFAKMGYSLLIISRTEEKLKNVMNDIKMQFPQCSEVKILAADFMEKNIYTIIEKEINLLPNIDVLLNNVGYNYPNTEYFTKIPYSTNDIFFNVNMYSCVKMCELIVPVMVKQKRGIIINLSSMAGDQPMPFTTVYSASKAFVDFLSRGLSLEYSSYGITVQSVCPSAVTTQLSKYYLKSYKLLRITTVNADNFVSEAIKTVGIEWRTYGHWKHKIIGFLLDHFILVFGEKIKAIILMMPIVWRHKKLRIKS